MGRIDTRADPDEVGDEVPAWDRLLMGDESALDDLTDEERARLEKFASTHGA